VQEDNITMELGWTPTSVREFAPTALVALAEAENYAKEKHAKLYIAPALHAPHGLLAHPDAQKFGCLPDQDAYLQGAMRPPLAAAEVGDVRFAGGHLHIGYDKKKALIPDWALVQLLDLVYLKTAIMDDYARKSKRDEWYGRPGIFREKPYGLEYRTPSNCWLKNTYLAREIFSYAEWFLNFPKEAQKIYRNTDWELVKQSYENYSNQVGDWLYSWVEILPDWEGREIHLLPSEKFPPPFNQRREALFEPHVAALPRAVVVRHGVVGQMELEAMEVEQVEEEV
jgi:hypothetical protein